MFLWLLVGFVVTIIAAAALLWINFIVSPALGRLNESRIAQVRQSYAIATVSSFFLFIDFLSFILSLRNLPLGAAWLEA